MTTKAAPRSPERGFALVGVIMFLLVLTILGLSLFSLTGYESQFMQQSMDGADSFHAAAGGLDRARFALAMTSNPASVKQNLPLDGVIYAVARRGNDSISTIDWDDASGPPVLIRVMAQKNGKTHFLEAQYSPSRARSIYKRLFSLSGSGEPDADSVGLRVIREDPAEDPVAQHNYMATGLYGECRQNDDNVPDHIFPFGDPPQSATLSLDIGSVPTPDVLTFRNAHWASATEVDLPNGPKNFSFDATGAPDSVRFYRTTWTSGWWSMDIPYDPPHYVNWDPNITVRGTVIWMFDHGIRSEGTVRVFGSGTPNDLLVLVADPGSDPGTFDPEMEDWNHHRSLTGAGIAFLGSISSNIPVILVSSGGVVLENRDFGLSTWPQTIEQDDKTSTTITCLSVFAPYARIMGPDGDNGGNPFRLSFARNATDPIDSRIDRLSDLGLLPNTAGGLKGKLRFLAGSWREVTETNPP